MKVKKTSGTSSNSHLLSFMYLALRGRLCRRIAGENKLFKPTLMYIYICQLEISILKTLNA